MMTVVSPLAASLALAAAAWFLLAELRWARGLVFTVSLPAVGSSVFLGTATTLSTAACIIMLAGAARRRHGTMLIWAGVSVGLDHQAGVLIPFVLALLIRRKVPLTWWPVALAAGVAVGSTTPGTSAALPVQPDVWMMAAASLGLDRYALVGLALTLTIGLAAAYAAWVSSRTFGERALMEVALLAPLTAELALPHSLAQPLLVLMLSAVIAFRWPDRRGIALALLIHTQAVLGTLADPSGTGPIAVLALAVTAWATLRLAKPLLRPAANDDPVMPLRAMAG